MGSRKRSNIDNHSGPFTSSMTSGTRTPVPDSSTTKAAEAAARRVVIELMAHDTIVWKAAIPTPTARTRPIVDNQCAADLTPGDIVVTQFHDGSVASQVQRVDGRGATVTGP